MPNTIAQKLRIKEGMTLLTLHAPENFVEHLQPLPEGVVITDQAKNYAQVHWFVTNKAQMDKEVDKVMKLLKKDVTCWAYYPKGTSKIKSDLTRDKGWESLLKHDEVQWLSLISFDETWSAFAFRLKTEADVKKEANTKEREIFKYIDAEKKIVLLPDDLAAAFKKDKDAKQLFDKLAFSHRKEYVEWIVTAKREETRSKRVEGTIERLRNGWKNPQSGALPPR